jgi:hypothetical protein
MWHPALSGITFEGLSTNPQFSRSKRIVLTSFEAQCRVRHRRAALFRRRRGTADRRSQGGTVGPGHRRVDRDSRTPRACGMPAVGRALVALRRRYCRALEQSAPPTARFGDDRQDRSPVPSRRLSSRSRSSTVRQQGPRSPRRSSRTAWHQCRNAGSTGQADRRPQVMRSTSSLPSKSLESASKRINDITVVDHGSGSNLALLVTNSAEVGLTAASSRSVGTRSRPTQCGPAVLDLRQSMVRQLTRTVTW